jgi:PAS domain S-box-containing protein
MSEIEDKDLDAIAAEFDGDDEDTSPEVVRHARALGVGGGSTNPMAVVASSDVPLRRELAELLWADGWNAVEVKSPEELIETVRATGPQVALVDADFHLPTGFTSPELLHQNRPDTAIRVVALLNNADTDEIAAAVVDGFDDFIMNPRNQVEVLARATANLRASRAVSEVSRQRRDLASLLELSQTLASSLDLTLILHTVSRLIASVIEVERCSIVLLDPNQQDGVMVAASEDRTVRDLRISINGYPELKRCVDTAAPVLITDAAHDPLLASVRDQVERTGIKGMALFPIVFEERVMGVLFLRTTEAGRKMSDYEVQFGQTVASACAVAVRNARMFDSVRDETERMNYMRLVAERQMEALKKYEDFFEYAADGMAIVDTDGEVLYVNREGRGLLAREQDEVRGKSFLTFVAEESAELWPEIVDQVRRGRFRRSFDIYALRGDGSERIFWLTAGGVGQDMGLLILSFRDVTETREMELELRTTKEFLENLIDNSVDAIVAADMSGSIMLFNKGAEQIFGYDAEDVVGRMHVQDLYPGNTAHDVMTQLRDDRWGGRGRLEAQRKTIIDRRRQVVPVSMTASIIYEDGEEELAGMAAHELNQPLTSVLGYAEMLRHKVREEKKNKKIADTIYEQAERMAEIVRKIGRITKYEIKHYGGRTNMIDLERSSSVEVDGDEHSESTDRNRIAAGGPPEGHSTGRFKSYPEQQKAERTDEELGAFRELPPTSGEMTDPPKKRRKVDGARLMAHLASKPRDSGGDEEVTDPRHAIVRPDTVDVRVQRRVDRRRSKKPPTTQEGGPIIDEDREHTQRHVRAPGPGMKSTALLDHFAGDQPSELDRTHAAVRREDLSKEDDAQRAKDRREKKAD